MARITMILKNCKRVRCVCKNETLPFQVEKILPICLHELRVKAAIVSVIGLATV